MATLQEAIKYASENPETPFANELRKRIESGSFNNELQQMRQPAQPQSIIPKPPLPEVSEAIGQFGIGALKGVGQTARTLGSVAPAIGSKLLVTGKKTETFTPISKEMVTPQGTAQKVGYGTEKIAEFFIPSSAVMKGTLLLKATNLATNLAKGGKVARLAETAITRGLSEAISGWGVTLAQTGDIGESIRNGIIAGSIPIVGKGLSILKSFYPSNIGKAIATGVPREIFQRVKQMPEVYDDALKYLSENPQQPFLGIAQSISNKLNSLKSKAKEAFDEAVNFTKTRFPETTFNLENKLSKLNNTLNKFNLSAGRKNIAGKFIANTPPTEKIIQYGIEKKPPVKMIDIVKPTTRTSPYTQQEIQQINELVRKMRVKDMSVDELMDFSESVKNFLGDAVQRDNKKMVKLGMSLLEDSIKFVDEVFPQIKQANNQYRAYYKALENYGNKIIDNTGGLKDTAEQFLSNIANLNKGEQREAIKILERVTGIPIIDNVIILKDAQKLSHLFPQTGSRTLDILRSLAVRGATIAGGIAGGVPGLIGGAALTAVSSPKLAGKTAIGTAKIAQKIRSGTPDIIKKTIQRALPGRF